MSTLAVIIVGVVLMLLIVPTVTLVERIERWIEDHHDLTGR